jgi:hypothetical protein
MKALGWLVRLLVGIGSSSHLSVVRCGLRRLKVCVLDLDTPA